MDSRTTHPNSFAKFREEMRWARQNAMSFTAYNESDRHGMMDQTQSEQGPSQLAQESHKGAHNDGTTKAFFAHSAGQRVNTDAVITAALKKQYPSLELIIAPAYTSDILAYAQAGHASYKSIADDGSDLPDNLQWEIYLPPARRMDGGTGGLAERVLYGKYEYRWRDAEFIVYFVSGRDGMASYPTVDNYFILTTSKAKAQQLILEAGSWFAELHDEIWVFDGGYWQKNKELYDSIRNATWESVILNEDMKKSIIDDHLSFFGSRDTYKKLRVPWKRGIIYHGPPGNGKTISIKAMMHMLYAQKPTSIPTLYVRSLFSYQGPQYSVNQVFAKARAYAPCYLVFEDLDTIITDNVRSYFLNEVDGLKNNDGVFMVGSTNHLDRLDPGISKRPSRFDRKYYFPDPSLEERVAYCKFWQRKLSDNEDIDFPDKLCKAIAEITDDFSFAYIQEAFVAALLAIARRIKTDDTSLEKRLEGLGDDWVGVDFEDEGDEDGIDDLVLWIEIQKQVAILRDGMDEEATVLKKNS